MRVFVLAAVAALAAPLAAQSGTVTYEATRPLRAQLPPGLADQGISLPTSQTSTRTLRFDGARGRTEAAASAPAVSAGGVVQMTTGAGPVHFVDREAGIWVRQLDLLGRPFRIEEAPPALPWRLTGEEGEFLGHPVQKAVATTDDGAVEAWFAPGIAAPLGPDQHGGLPGLILVLEVADGPTFRATEIALGAAAEVGAPTEGEVVTREEYDAILQERLEALRTYRGAGNVKVIPVN